MNNYRVSIDLTISTGVNSSLNLVELGSDVANKIITAIGSYDEPIIQINKISTDVVNRPPIYAMPPVIDIKKVAIDPDDDDDEFLEPEWGIYEDDGT